jgi:hypothetical protein
VSPQWCEDRLAGGDAPPGQIELVWGWYLALAGSALMLAGAVRRSGESERRRKPPGTISREPSTSVHPKRRAPITARLRPRISMWQSHTSDPASLPGAAGIPALQAQRSWTTR